MKLISVLAAVLVSLSIPAATYAAVNKSMSVDKTTTMDALCRGLGYTLPTSLPTPAPSPTPTPPLSTPVPGDKVITAYTTGYGWPDNTPPSAEISDGVIHSSAGGTGTYADPITVAVGHSIIGSKDILDYPKGTKFYFPFLLKYGIVEDTCGDGGAPQNGPCHTGYKGNPWIDLWVGGTNQSASGTLACEDAITDIHQVILNPVSTYPVKVGPVYNGTCAI